MWHGNKLFHRCCNDVKFLSSIYFRKSEKILKNKCTLIRTFSSHRDPLTIHEISIKSCGALYEQWKHSGKFPTVPDKALNIKVNYFDTDKESSISVEKKKTVVALHGAPGTCKDYTNLAAYLHKNGVRFIVPTFPNFSTFPPGVFRHTDEERAQFVKDFLSAISVSHVDLLVCHSGSVYPALNLCLAQNPVIKSIAMLNPAGYSLNMPAIRFFSFLKWMIKLSETPAYLKVLKVIGPITLKMIRAPVRVNNILDPLLSAATMVNGNILQAKEKLLQLYSANFPILFAFSENDKLVGKEPSYELVNLLGASSSDIYYINKNGEFERNGKETSTLKIMAFENGSHYVFWKYPSIIHEAILKFLRR